MATFRSSSKNTKKLNSQSISNIDLFPIHMKSELGMGMLSIAKKLVKDVIHLWWWNFEK
jgi:hypothetical protein